MKKFVAFGLMSLCLFTVGVLRAQVNPYLSPERVNPRLNVSLEIAKLIKAFGYDRVAVVFMENSELCAIYAGSLVTALRSQGLQAYYVRGGEQLGEQLKSLKPDAIYLAHFGERPLDEAQRETTRDLRTIAELYAHSQKLPKVLIHPSTFQQGFLAGALVDDKISTFLEKADIMAFAVQGGKVVPLKLTVKDFEIKASEAKPPTSPKTPTKRRR